MWTLVVIGRKSFHTFYDHAGAKGSNISQEDVFEFDDSEVALFWRRFEEGYDLKSDVRYNAWLSMQCKSPIAIHTLYRDVHVYCNNLFLFV